MRYIFLLGILLGTMNMWHTDLPVVGTREDCEKYWEQKVILVGTYQDLMLPESKRPESEIKKSGRISIDLNGYEIALDHGPAGFRENEEKTLYLGKKVKVTGVIYKNMPLWGDGREQAIVMPVITEIKSVEFAD